jgi:hypothetical protein
LAVGFVAAVIAYLSWRAAKSSALQAKRSADAGIRSATAAETAARANEAMALEAVRSATAGEAAARANEAMALEAVRSATAGEAAARANEAMALEAERLRREQSQPYVVVFAEQLAAHRYVLDLVIKNLGTTAAYAVRVEITPTPRRSFDDHRGSREVWLPSVIPVLVPQQEWRTRWDLANHRRDAGLPDRHDATVTFTDSQGRGADGSQGRFNYDFVVDWGAYWGQVGMGEPDIAESIRDGLQEISEKLDPVVRPE